MKAKQVAVVEITKGGSDKAVFVDGHYIDGADPVEGDSLTMVEEVAEALGDAAGISVTRLLYDANNDEWQWGEVERDLKDLRRLHKDDIGRGS